MAKDCDCQKRHDGQKDRKKKDCDDKCCKEAKKCFGYWGVPRELKCGVPCQYDQLRFKDIPNGSIYFAERWDAYGALRSLASAQKWSLIGIIVQIGRNRQESQPHVFTVFYNKTVALIPLVELMQDPLVISQGVRSKLRACNSCAEADQVRFLTRVIRRYLGAPFESNGAQVARSIFDIPAINPNEDSYVDTELVYRVLFESALIGNCCPPNEIPDCPIQKCSQFDDYSVESSACTLPCDKKCCESSSSSTCNPCDKVDVYRASSVSICDFITADYLDMRWYYPMASIYTEPMDACRREIAINQSFAQDGPCLLMNIRQLVTLWQSGFSFPNWKTNKCNPCEPIKLDCGEKKCGCKKETVESCESVVPESLASIVSSAIKPEQCDSVKPEPCKEKKDCPKNACDKINCNATQQEVLAVIATLQSAVNQLLTNGPLVGNNGNLLFAYFQSVMDFLGSLICKPVPQLAPVAGGNFTLSFTLSPLTLPRPPIVGPCPPVAGPCGPVADCVDGCESVAEGGSNRFLAELDALVNGVNIAQVR